MSILVHFLSARVLAGIQFLFTPERKLVYFEPRTNKKVLNYMEILLVSIEDVSYDMNSGKQEQLVTR